jgi:NAD(P)-dependent dehydrogenase (short-subunit alcohol dehydrogenase family)
VITGGASGLGLQTAKRIVAEGGRVALWDVEALRLTDDMRETNAFFMQVVDVSDSLAVAEAARKSYETLGKIDILVSSAGITGATVPVTEFPIDSWLRVIAVNLTGLSRY